MSSGENKGGGRMGEKDGRRAGGEEGRGGHCDYLLSYCCLLAGGEGGHARRQLDVHRPPATHEAPGAERPSTAGCGAAAGSGGGCGQRHGDTRPAATAAATTAAAAASAAATAAATADPGGQVVVVTGACPGGCAAGRLGRAVHDLMRPAAADGALFGVRRLLPGLVLTYCN